MMTEKNKMECDDLLKTHEMTQKLLDANTADAAMLATLVQMARGGKDEMAMYMLHNLKPYAIEIAEGGKERVSRKSTLTHCSAPCSAKQQKLGGEIHRVFLCNFHKPFLGGPRTLGADRVFVNTQVAQISRSIFVQSDD